MDGPAVTVIGLGTMGGIAAARLVSCGWRVTGFDVSELALTRATESGVVPADSGPAAAAASDIVLLSLPMPADTRSVCDELAGTLGVGTVVVDLSTIDPTTARQAADTLGNTGAGYVDAPVLGRPQAVGSWTCVLGGADEACTRAGAFLLGTLAKNVVRAGEVGTASVVKILNNLMFGAINAVTVEVITLAEATGLDPGMFVDIVAGSGAASVSGLFRDIAPRIVDGDFTPTFSIGLLHKDNQLAMDLAEEFSVPIVAGRSVHLLNTMAVSAGLSASDSSAVIRVYEMLTGLTPRRHVAVKPSL